VIRNLFAAVGALVLATNVNAGDQVPNEPQKLTFERVFESPSLNGFTPREAKISPDGRFLTLLRNRDDDSARYDLWGFDRESGQWSMLVNSEDFSTGRALSEDELMQRERRRVGSLKGIITYQWARDSKSLLVPIDGDLFLASIDGKVVRLTDTEEVELNPTLSPKAGYISFVRNRQLWVGRVGEVPRPITPKESPNIRWGEAEFVAQEEMARFTGFWWNNDETRLVVQRTDEEPVGIVTRAAIAASGTEVFEQRYPVAGSDNALIELHIMDPDGQNSVRVDLGESTDIYIARVDWGPDGNIYIQRQSREQTKLDVLKVDPKTGRSTVWFTETRAIQDFWVNLSDNYKFLQDGSLIWWSERSGFGHLYHFTQQGFRQLTDGEWVVTSLIGVDEENGKIYFEANADGILERHIYSLSLGTPTNLERLTEPGFVNSGIMDLSAQTLLVYRSASDQPPQSYLADSSGNRILWIEENALDLDHPYAPYFASHVTPEFGSLEADDGTPLHWMMLKPEMEPGKRYPVFFYHYGGPGPQIVDRGWGGALAQAVVDKGYIWFALDNRGSNNRGVVFEQPIYRAMGTVEVQDQAKGTDYLNSLDYVDPNKIAIYGWSYGGYLTLKRLQAEPGVYAAGISGAPVTKWELYDTHYTERYMGDPRIIPTAYEDSGAIKDAVKITDPLLIVHGMADDNVVFEHSTELIAKLQNENIQFEMMLYPGQTHRVGGEKVSPHLWNTYFQFLEKHGVAPPN
jgi:dipeptidyl-peptidase-4